MRLPSVPLVAAALVASLLAGAAQASLVTSMDVGTLTRLSAVVVRGRVESVATSFERGAIETWVTLRVDESLKGAAGRRSLSVSVPGGTFGDWESRVIGAPRFRVGERVVLFATPTKRGPLTVTGLFQGKFRIERAASGGEEAVPEPGDGARVVGEDTRSRGALGPFLDVVRQWVRRHPGPALAPSATREAPASAEPIVTPAFTLLPLIPFRYFEPDTGAPVSFRFNAAGAPVSPAAAQAGFTAARQHWTNVTGSAVSIADGGATTQACHILFDGSNISHGDLCAQMPPFDPVGCSGVLAITGTGGFSIPIESKIVNGTSFLRMTQSDIVFNAGTQCFFAADPRNYEEVFSHEMGHAIGLGHSCGDAYTAACVPGSEADDALMRAFAHGGRGGAPRADDVDGIRFIYPPGGFVDLQFNGTAVATGQPTSLKADLNGTVAADIYVLLAYPSGVFVSLAPGFPINTLAPLATGVPLSFVKDVPLFNYTWTGAEPAGSYTWYGILARAGTDVTNSANWLGYDVAGFTFTP